MKGIRLHTLAVVACSGVLAMTAVGCGGGSEEKKTDPAKAALTAYRAEANKACAEAIKGMEKIGTGLTVQSPKSEQNAAFVKIGQAFLDEVTDLRAIKAPAAVAPDVDAWLAALTKAANTVKEQGVALLKQGAPAAFADSDAKATALGLTKCATSAG